MKTLIIFLSTFLSWSAFDPNLHRRRRNASEGENVEYSLYDEKNEVEQEQKRIQKKRDIIPLRFRNRKVKLRSKCNYSGTKSKDVRDSNQRKIRRKFNNM